MELGKNILNLCKKKRMSISQLAKESGVKQPTLHGWTTGRSVQNLDDLRKVCKVLEVGLHTLLFGEADPFEANERIFREIFKGEVRLTIHKVNRDKE